MASELKKFYTGTRTAHTVGNVTGWQQPVTIKNGVKVSQDGDVDNFRLVKRSFNTTKGEFEIKYASANTPADKLFLTITPETVLDGEYVSDFYNAKGELATVAELPVGFTFQTSAVEEATGAGKVDLKVGALVIPAANGTFITPNTASPATNANKVFEVIDIEEDERYSIDGATLYELRVVK